MIKNQASQKVGCQMVSATDGSAFTGAVTVSVTGDAGTQAAGSVGAGACTHEGNGYHTYAPAQSETNYDLIAFTFTGTGAIPATVQVYTITGDAFARLGAPAGASVSADVAAVKAETATILTDTNDIQTRLPAALVSGRMDASVGAMASAVLTATAIAADAITDAKVAADVTIASVTGAVGSVTGAVGSVAGNVDGNVTGSVGGVATGGISAASFAAGAIDAAAIAADAIGASELAASAVAEIQSGLSTLDAAAVRAAVGLASANLDTQLDALPTNAELATALGTADDAVLAAIAALNNLSSAGAQAAASAALTAYGAALQSTLLTGVGYIDTEVAAIKAKTDNLTFTSGTDLDVNVQKVNDVALLGDGAATPWGPV